MVYVDDSAYKHQTHKPRWLTWSKRRQPPHFIELENKLPAIALPFLLTLTYDV